ncbi:indole-3-glycerol phosphate synthase TrpC [Thermodesulfovibrio hydrogeniphilus]
MNILHRIVEQKRKRVEEQKKAIPLEKLSEKAISLKKSSHFFKKIKRSSDEPIKIIAEIKKASPSKGLLREFDVCEMADIYVSSGADAISVLTEEDFFLGSPDFLVKIKKRHPDVPVLRKDFIFDEYQIYESKILGADAVLLIAKILTEEECQRLFSLSKSLGLDVLFEIHDEEDLKKALKVDVDIIGINNRNLETLQVDLNTTFRLRELIPDGKIVVSESGISSRGDIEKLLQYDIDAVLVGTSIVLSDSPSEKIKELKWGI